MSKSLNGYPSLGSNDSTGLVKCGLCDWQKQCSTFESLEFELARHLRDAHGRRIYLKHNDDNGEVRDVPQLDES